jgi:hypothetical protein
VAGEPGDRQARMADDGLAEIRLRRSLGRVLIIRFL